MGRDINRMRMGISINRKLGERINKMSEETRISKAKLFDEALEYLFQIHDIKIEDYDYRFKLNRAN